MEATNIPERPIFKRHFHVELLEPEHVLLISEDRYHIFSGNAYLRVASSLDGQRSVKDLIALLAEKVSAAEIYYVLTMLAREGLLTDGGSALPEKTQAFWDALGAEAQFAAERQAGARIGLRALAECSEAPLREALSQLGLTLDEDEHELEIILTDHYLRPELTFINEEALAKGKSWMLTKPVGQTLWIGPIFTPSRTGCWACLSERLRLNFPVEDFIMRKTGRPVPLKTSRAAILSTIKVGASLASIEAAKWLVLDEHPLEGALLALDTRNLETSIHTLVRRPQCSACGNPEKHLTLRPVTLAPSKKLFVNDGGHRSVSPEETFKRFKHHISPITGVVNWLVNSTGEVNGLTFTYSAGHNFAMGIDNIYWLRKSLRSRTGGKGMTDIQAKVSAMGEAIERYSGVYRGDEIKVSGSYRSLGEQAVHLHDCLRFSDWQYENRESWNASQTDSFFHIIPHRFDENAEMDWTPVWSLTKNEFRYLPASFCYYGHPDSERFFFCSGDTNGCSAGNRLEEAILQAFFELVERDCVALWWYNRLLRPPLDLDSFDLPYLDALRAFYRTLNREFWVLDITSDLDIPAFAAVSRRTDQPVEDILLAFGVHFDPKIALLRAVTELNQFLGAVTKVDAAGKTIYVWPDGEAINWWKKATIENQPYLVADPRARARRLTDFPLLCSDDLMQDVLKCVEITRGLGMEMFVLDQTRPDIGMSVCRVIVPGMRHFWRRLGPGRLYDVPVKLGWLAAPTLEQDLNPLSIFF